MKKVLVIIPAYNEELNIEKVINSLQNDRNAAAFDYLIINDGSTDNTAELCLKKHFSFVNLPCNLGIGGAVQTGYKYAARNGYDISVQIDGDGQHNVEYISKGIELLESGHDMVIGSRFIEKSDGFQSSFLRRMGIGVISKTIRILTGKTVKDITSGFRICNKKMTCFFADNYEQDYPEPQAVLAALLQGYSVAEYPVVMNERLSGKSSIGGFKSMKYMIQVTLTLLLSYWRYRKVEK